MSQFSRQSFSEVQVAELTAVFDGVLEDAYANGFIGTKSLAYIRTRLEERLADLQQRRAKLDKPVAA